MMKSLDPSWGKQVLAYLTQFVDLTAERFPGGIVAGQAVASAVSGLFGDGTAVIYNDIDVFRPMPDDRKRSTKGRVLGMAAEMSTYSSESYGHLNASDTFHYRVARTSRDGMLNEILTFGDTKDFLSGSKNITRFLQSFDFNCVQVGIDLATSELVWTEDYADFFRTKELLVSNVRTPVHSAIRWFKKVKELKGIYANTEAAMEILGTCIAVYQGAKHQSDVLLFSSPYKAKYDDVAAEISKWFDLSETTGKDIPLFSLKPRFELPQQLIQSSYSCYYLVPTVARALRGFWRRHVCEDILNALDNDKGRLEYLALRIHGPREFFKQRSQLELRQANTMFDEHTLGAWGKGMRLDELLAFTGLVRKCVKQHGLWFYGALELADSKTVEAFKGCSADQWGEWLDTFALESEIEMSKVIAPNTSWPELLHSGYRVRELVKKMDLLSEGIRMHHCVGGYFRHVSKGYSKIISMQTADINSCITMELNREFLLWTKAQAVGLGNRCLTDEEKHSVAQVIALYNLSMFLRILPLVWSKAILESISSSKTLVAKVVDLFKTMKTREAKMLVWKSATRRAWYSLRTSWRNGKPTFSPKLAGNVGFDDMQDNVPF